MSNKKWFEETKEFHKASESLGTFGIYSLFIFSMLVFYMLFKWKLVLFLFIVSIPVWLLVTLNWIIQTNNLGKVIRGGERKHRDEEEY